MVYRQETVKTLNFEAISLEPRYNLRRSLAFQTTSYLRLDLFFPLF